MKRHDAYIDTIRMVPSFSDLTIAEARFVTRLVDDVVVDGRRLLILGPRERDGLVAAIPRLRTRLETRDEWTVMKLAVPDAQSTGTWLANARRKSRSSPAVPPVPTTT